MKYLNIVFVKHIKSGKRYVFKAPLNASVKRDDILLVETKRGIKRAIATSDNLILSEDVVWQIAMNGGAYWPLANVLGLVKTREELQRFDSEDGQIDELPFPVA